MAMGNMHKKFGEVAAQFSSYASGQTDRQTDKHTDAQTDRLITMLHHPNGAK